jgi:hypothetical protein
MQNMETITELIELMRKEKYFCDFKLKDNMLVCEKTHEFFNPEELAIKKIYRFEGNSDPSDMAILYGIASKNGTKGILLDAYGAYANSILGDFIKKIPVINR